METIRTILYVVVELAFGLLALGIFIQTNVELWNEMKHKFNDTKVGMWYKNRKNGVEILSDRKYKHLLKSGQIKNIIIVED